MTEIVAGRIPWGDFPPPPQIPTSPVADFAAYHSIKHPKVRTHQDAATCIVVRSPKPPKGVLWSWWTPDALDGEQWSSVGGWYQVGFVLHSPVHLKDKGESAARPAPIGFFEDVSRALGKMYEGGSILEFKDPDEIHTQYPITLGRPERFTLRELRDMSMSRADRARKGSEAKTPKKADAVRKNLAVANTKRYETAGERYSHVMQMLEMGMTVRMIGVSQKMSYEGAKTLCRRAKAWAAEQ